MKMIMIKSNPIFAFGIMLTNKLKQMMLCKIRSSQLYSHAISYDASVFGIILTIKSKQLMQ